MTAYPHLFSPVRVGTRTLPNRIVHAAVATHFAERGRVTQPLIDYFVNRARGGASVLVSEPMSMLRWHDIPTRPMAFTAENEAAFVRWTHAVEKAGGAMLAQVQDNGRGFRSGGRNDYAYGASALPDDLSWTVPHVLTAAQVETMIDEFTASSARLARCGFSGVEISAGHGHLFHQFLSRRSNVREDRFGGELTGRARLLTELILRLRATCGRDFLIGVKLPAEDFLKGGIDLTEAAAITSLVAATGAVDYLTWCWGSHGDSLHTHLPDLHGPRAPFVERIAQLGKAARGIPIGALGLITDPNEGERIVRQGQADLVMLGRPLVTDAAWGAKARDGREADIRYCVSCNTCWHMITTGRTLRCDNNPRVGAADEADWVPPRAGTTRRIVVVGSGIAGLEAAWVAAARGHAVTLFGAGDEAGGKTRLNAGLPGGENLSSIYDYQLLQAARYAVDMRMGRAASADDIVALVPDQVIVATGATPAWPDYLPDDWRDVFPDLRTLVASMRGVTARQPGTLVIDDADHGGFTYAAIEWLAHRYERVVVLTSRTQLASDLSIVARQGVYERLSRARVEIVTSVRVAPASCFEEGEVALVNIYNGDTRVIGGVAMFAYATQRVPDDALVGALRSRGIDAVAVGDAYAPRSVLIATTEGYRAGMEA